jgi:hypothetical protein
MSATQPTQPRTLSTLLHLSTWSTRKIGLIALVGTVLTRVVLGNFVVNEWEGWGVFVPNTIIAILEGVILWALLFVLPLRLGRGRAGPSGIVMGVLALASFAIPYSAQQVLLSAAAIALGLLGRSRVALALGGAGVALWIGFMVYAVISKEWPV